MRNNLYLNDSEIKYWPPVPTFTELEKQFANFLQLSIEEQINYLDKYCFSNESIEIIQLFLSNIFSYYYGYKDSCIYHNINLETESSLYQAKCVLVDYYINSWLNIPYKTINKHLALKQLRTMIASNSGINHDFFDYIETEMPQDAFIEFLKLEVCRNEIVDDEVALLTVGLQGSMKSVIASNLWDECGNGKLHKFHTYWLRQLLCHMNIYDDLIEYRKVDRPWFSNITSNTLNSLLTTPAYKMRAYGCFLTTEAWVNQHFIKILNGLKRVNLFDENITIYFNAHIGIDIRHTEEIYTALDSHLPYLSDFEMSEIIYGSKIAEKSSTLSYDLSLKYFKNKYK